ncbi:hypothetical protein KY49_704 [Burkholderia sp. MSHR3999]|uniref:winged helix-turn-helix domain-containing protein n=1 Tax=Burkholderia sp. MSHR3999 TaxID=1542965 RepID=UPI0005ACC02C|nr:winged helix-turn-helix domain-containing protein [Burkholderia sp. MSHR3999]KIP13932.1 hypothetical protein KY49_704 [Burkholderia sp. MSHR3999]
MGEGKMGPISRKILECVKANPGIHASDVARQLDLGDGGGTRETIRTLIARGYLVRGTKKHVPGAKGHTVYPLTYTGKPFERSDDWAVSTRWKTRQDRMVAEAEREAQALTAIDWTGQAIRAMVASARAAA